MADKHAWKQPGWDSKSLRTTIRGLVEDFEQLEEEILPLPPESGHYDHHERVLRKKRASVVRSVINLALEVAINQPEHVRRNEE